MNLVPKLFWNPGPKLIWDSIVVMKKDKTDRWQCGGVYIVYKTPKNGARDVSGMGILEHPGD